MEKFHLYTTVVLPWQRIAASETRFRPEVHLLPNSFIWTRNTLIKKFWLLRCRMTSHEHIIKWNLQYQQVKHSFLARGRLPPTTWGVSKNFSGKRCSDLKPYEWVVTFWFILTIQAPWNSTSFWFKGCWPLWCSTVLHLDIKKKKSNVSSVNVISPTFSQWMFSTYVKKTSSEITAISHSYHTTANTSPTYTFGACIWGVCSLCYTPQMFLASQGHTEYIFKRKQLSYDQKIFPFQFTCIFVCNLHVKNTEKLFA